MIESNSVTLRELTALEIAFVAGGNGMLGSGTRQDGGGGTIGSGTRQDGGGTIGSGT